LSKPIKGRLSNFSVRDFRTFFQKHLTYFGWNLLKTVKATDGVFFDVKESDFDGQWRIFPKILPFQVVRRFKALSEKFDILGI
jgi:hypothetical protein